jgi:zinc/manganese transport system substrate-binding protein
MMPENKQYFIDRKMIYLNRLDDLNKKLSFELSKIPISHRIVVTSHDAFAYLGREFQIEFLAPLGLSLDVEASAEDIAYVIDQIRERNVRALFIENINNPKLLQMISLESDIAVGGRIYSDALSEIEGPASTYLKMMEHNLMSLIEAFDLKESEV